MPSNSEPIDAEAIPDAPEMIYETAGQSHELAAAPADIQPFSGVLDGTLTPAEIDAKVAMLQSKVYAFKRIMSAAIGLTTYNHWVEMRQDGSNAEGQPYLEENGAVRLIQPFKIRIVATSQRKVNYPDGTYEFVFEGYVTALLFSETPVPVMGSRWSGDPFFKRQRDTVDPGDVRLAAMTNFRGNAVRLALGLDGVTWEDLADSKIDRAKVKGFKFKDRREGGGDAPKVEDYKAADETQTAAGKTEGAGGVLVAVLEVKVSSGTNAKSGKAWKRFAATLKSADNGQEFQASTFDTKMGDALVNAKTKKVQATVWLEQEGQFTNIIGVVLAEGS